MKKCTRCKEFKALTEYHRSLGSGDGLQSLCKPCQRESARSLRARNKAKRLQVQDTAQGFAEQVNSPPPVVSTDPVEAIEITEVKPEPKAPLETAYEKHAEAKQKRDLGAEHKALILENTALKDKIGELVEMQKPPDILVYEKPIWERADAIACAVASDWHVEEPVVKESVHGLNEYNLDVAKSRSEHFFKNLLSLTDMMARDSIVKTLHLSILGDFFSGWIHEELIAGNLLPPGAAANFWKGLFISGIDFLLRESSYVIEGDMIPGNHGRMTHKIHIGDPTGTSLETFAYHALAGRYDGNPRVRLRVSEHGMVYRRFFEKFNMRLIHGYEVKYGGGIGGLTIPLRKALAAWNNPIRADLTVLGHFHQLCDGGDFIVNGSLIGYNNFAQAIRASAEEARQAFFLIHARNGGQKSVTAPIWLDDSHRTGGA